MKRDTVNYVAVGAFVLAMGFAFLVVMYLVTGRQGPTETYYIQLGNVSGIKYGTGVFYEGYRIGQVEAVEPRAAEAGMRYRLELSIRRDWAIPRDSVARVVASGLIAAVNIEIAGGTASATIPAGGVIPSEERPDLFAALGNAATDFRELSQAGVMPLLATLDGRVNEVADEMIALQHEHLAPLIDGLDENLNSALFEQISGVLARLDGTIASVDRVLSERNLRRVESLLVELEQTATGLNELVASVSETRTTIRSVMTEVEDLVSENGPRVKTTMAQLDRASASLERTSAVVAEEIDTIVHNLSTTSRNMNEFSRAVRDNPSRIIRSVPATEAEGP